jgi:hypothetical protein
MCCEHEVYFLERIERRYDKIGIISEVLFLYSLAIFIDAKRYAQGEPLNDDLYGSYQHLQLPLVSRR